MAMAAATNTAVLRNVSAQTCCKYEREEEEEGDV